MLDERQFGDWCRRLGFSSRVKNLIRWIRSSEPARHVRSGHGNVSGRYPSRKMGVTIQFESHRNELAAIYEMEHSSAVWEYWDQPSPIKLEYRTPAGRAIGVLHTPDFFVLRADSAGWEEWKLEEDLRRLASSQPNRYRRTDDGGWRCPPGEEYAREFGLYYRLRSSAEINWVFQRNIIFLEDYLRSDSPPIEPTLEDAVRRLVAAQPGITLRELLQQYEASADVIYILIATERVYVDLDAVALAEPAWAPIFADRQTAIAYSHVCESVEADEMLLSQRLRDMAVNRSLDMVESDSDLVSANKASGESGDATAQCNNETNDAMARSVSEEDYRHLLPEY